MKPILDDIKPNTRMLFIFPHPDDETAFSGGLALELEKFNVDKFLICMTCGEKSSLKYGVKPNENLGNVRQLELKRAGEILGMRKTECLNLPDGLLHENSKILKEKVESKINEIRPDYVITYEPFGVYGHTDHITLSEVITEIYEKTKKFKLIYSTVSEEYEPSKGEKEMAKVTKVPAKPTHYLNLSFINIIKKLSAFRAHSSQYQFGLRFIKQWHDKGELLHEYFTIPS